MRTGCLSQPGKLSFKQFRPRPASDRVQHVVRQFMGQADHVDIGHARTGRIAGKTVLAPTQWQIKDIDSGSRSNPVCARRRTQPAGDGDDIHLPRLSRNRRHQTLHGVQVLCRCRVVVDEQDTELHQQLSVAALKVQRVCNPLTTGS